MEHTIPVLNKELLKSELRLVALDLPVKHTHLLVKKLTLVSMDPHTNTYCY